MSAAVLSPRDLVSIAPGVALPGPSDCCPIPFVGCNVPVILCWSCLRCRFLAFQGEPILLETLLAAPCRSLFHQSLHATEAKTETNCDSFGVGRYGKRETPGLYREVRPAWSDELYAARAGTTNSEATLLAAFARGLDRDCVGAMAATLPDVKRHMLAAGVEEALRFTAMLTDGHTLWAFRWACDARPPTPYYKDGPAGLLLMSEPIDGDRGCWREVPRGGTLIATPGQVLRLERMDAEIVLAA